MALYEQSLLQEVFSLPILHPRKPSTASIVFSLTIFVRWLRSVCNKEGLRRGLRALDLLESDILPALKKKASRTMAARAVKTKGRDSARLAKLAPPDRLREAIKTSITDLAYIAGLFEQAKAVPGCYFQWQHKYAATCIGEGLTFANAYAGRPGEWAAIGRDEIEALLREETDCLSLEGKTVDTFGALGRHIPPGNRKVYQLLLAMHSGESKLFFEPAKVRGKPIQAARVLSRWSQVYFPEYEAIAPTLQRKRFHSTGGDQTSEEKAFKLLCAALQCHQAGGRRLETEECL